ncbi:MAG: hypothetical protein ACI89X_001261 [Planctomycetota bacterium]|jgi:hypothetical protein
MYAVLGSETLYAKLYSRRKRTAAAEWHWLHMLPLLGLESAQPIAWLADRRASMIVTASVKGRSLDAWLVDAAAEGWLGDVFDYVCREVAPFARRLHDQGLIHRDLNCAHLFATDPRSAGRPAVIDVERMFRPRWRWRRWVVKELASLLASSPVPVSLRVCLRFLRCYQPEWSKGQRRKLVRAVGRKVARVLAHVPRFG